MWPFLPNEQSSLRKHEEFSVANHVQKEAFLRERLITERKSTLQITTLYEKEKEVIIQKAKSESNKYIKKLRKLEGEIARLKSENDEFRSDKVSASSLPSSAKDDEIKNIRATIANLVAEKDNLVFEIQKKDDTILRLEHEVEIKYKEQAIMQKELAEKIHFNTTIERNYNRFITSKKIEEEDLQQNLTEQNNKMKDAMSQIQQSSEARVSQLESQIQDYINKVDYLQSENEILLKKYDNLKTVTDQNALVFEEKLQRQKHEMKALQSEKSQIELANSDLLENNLEKEKEIEDLLSTLEEAKQAILTSETGWKQRLEKIKSRNFEKIGNLNNNLEAAQTEISEKNAEIAKMKVQLEEITGLLEYSRSEITQLQGKSHEIATIWKSEFDSMAIEKSHLQSEFLKIKDKNVELEEDVKIVTGKSRSFAAEIDKLEADILLLRKKNCEKENLCEEYITNEQILVDTLSKELVATKKESSQLLQKITIEKQALVEEIQNLRQLLTDEGKKSKETEQELFCENEKRIISSALLEKQLADAQETIFDQTVLLQVFRESESKWIEEKENLIARSIDLERISELLLLKEEEIKKLCEDYSAVLENVSTKEEKWIIKIRDAENKQGSLEEKLSESVSENAKSVATLNTRLEQEMMQSEEMKKQYERLVHQNNSDIELLQSKIAELLLEVQTLRSSIQHKDDDIISLEERIQSSKMQTQNKHNRWRQQIKELRGKNAELVLSVQSAEQNSLQITETLKEKDAALQTTINQHAEILSLKEEEKLVELKRLAEHMEETMKNALLHEHNEWKTKLNELSITWEEKEFSLNSKIIKLAETVELKENELALNNDQLQYTKKYLESLKIENEVTEKKVMEMEDKLKQVFDELNFKESKLNSFAAEINLKQNLIIELEISLARLSDNFSVVDTEKHLLQKSCEDQKATFEAYSRQTEILLTEYKEKCTIIHQETITYETVEGLQKDLQSRNAELQNVQILVEKLQGEKLILETEMLQCQSEREQFWQELLEEKEVECKMLLDKVELLQSMVVNVSTSVVPISISRQPAEKELSQVLAQRVLESRDALFSQFAAKDLIISSIQTEIFEIKKELSAVKEEKDGLKQRMKGWKQKIKSQFEQEKQEWLQQAERKAACVEQFIQTDEEIVFLSKASLTQMEEQGKSYETLKTDYRGKEEIIGNLLSEKDQLQRGLKETEKKLVELEEKIKSMKVKFRTHSTKLQERISTLETEKNFLEHATNHLENKLMSQEEVFSRTITTKKVLTFLDPLYVTPPGSPNRGADISGSSTLASSVTTTGTMSTTSECCDASTIATTSSPAKDPNPTPHRLILSNDNTPTVKSLQQEIMFLKKKYKDRTQYSMAKIRTLQHELDIKSQEFCTLQHEYNQLESAYSQLVEDFQSLSTSQSPESAELKEGDGDGNEADINIDAGVALESIQQEFLDANTEATKEDINVTQEKKIMSLKLMCEKLVEKYEIQKQKLLNKLNQKREIIQVLKDSVKEHGEKVSKLTNSLKSILAEKRTQNVKLTTQIVSNNNSECLGIAELDEESMLLDFKEEEDRSFSCGTEKDDQSFSVAVKEAKALVSVEETSTYRHHDLIDELYNIHRVLINSLNEIDASKSSALASFPNASTMLSTVISPFAGENDVLLGSEGSNIDAQSLTALVESLVRRIKDLEEDKGMKLQVNANECTPSSDVATSESNDCSSPMSLMSLASVHGTVMSMAKGTKQHGHASSTPLFDATMIMPTCMSVLEETIKNIRNQLHYYLTAQSIQETEHYSTSLILLLHCTDEERDIIFAMMMKLAPMIVAYTSFESISEDFSATIESIVYGKDTGSDTGSEVSFGSAWRRRGKSVPDIAEQSLSLHTPHKTHTSHFFGLPLDHDSHLSPPPSANIK